MTSLSYAAELERIKDDDLRAELDRLIRLDDRIPTGPLGAWALAYARWRRGDRDTYPLPPSAARGVTPDGILRIDAIVSRLVDWRPRTTPPTEVLVDDDVLIPRQRVADWNPTA